MTVYKMKNGCFMCGGDVFGNNELKYLCKPCNILYTEEELLASQKIREEMINQAPVEEVQAEEKEGTPKEPAMFVGSILSMRYHRTDCPYILKILKENKVTIKSHSEAKELGYKPCVCLKVDDTRK
jgi:hypothetical protein